MTDRSRSRQGRPAARAASCAAAHRLEHVVGGPGVQLEQALLLVAEVRVDDGLRDPCRPARCRRSSSPGSPSRPCRPPAPTGSGRDAGPSSTAGSSAGSTRLRIGRDCNGQSRPVTELTGPDGRCLAAGAASSWSDAMPTARLARPSGARLRGVGRGAHGLRGRRVPPRLARRRGRRRAGALLRRGVGGLAVPRAAAGRLRGAAGAGRRRPRPVRLAADDPGRRADDGRRPARARPRHRRADRHRRPRAGRRRRRDDVHQRAAGDRPVVPRPHGPADHPAHRHPRPARLRSPRPTRWSRCCTAPRGGRRSSAPPATGVLVGVLVAASPCATPRPAPCVPAPRRPRRAAAQPGRHLARAGHPDRAVHAPGHPVLRHRLRAAVGLPVPRRGPGALPGDGGRRCSPCWWSSAWASGRCWAGSAGAGRCAGRSWSSRSSAPPPPSGPSCCCGRAARRCRCWSLLVVVLAPTAPAR